MTHVKEFGQQEWKISIDVGQQGTKYKIMYAHENHQQYIYNEWMQHDDDYITAILATMPETQIGDAKKHASETKKTRVTKFSSPM